MLHPADYDRIAGAWAAHRLAFTPALHRLLDALTAPLAPGASVLDVGCGSGLPVSRHLASQGFRVTGLDASARLLAFAHGAVPEATFLHGDLRTATFETSFDALIAWDVLFHVPRDDHRAVFARFSAWLRPGGRLLVSLGASAGAFTSEMFGTSFFYNAHAPAYARRLLSRAGFRILHFEVDDPSSRGHVAILAVRRG